MTELIFENLTYIGYAAALLATVWLANFLLEIYYTCLLYTSMCTAG